MVYGLSRSSPRTFLAHLRAATSAAVVLSRTQLPYYLLVLAAAVSPHLDAAPPPCPQCVPVCPCFMPVSACDPVSVDPSPVCPGSPRCLFIETFVSVRKTRGRVRPSLGTATQLPKLFLTEPLSIRSFTFPVVNSPLYIVRGETLRLPRCVSTGPLAVRLAEMAI